MSFLILSDKTYTRIQEIRDLARANQMTWEEMEAISKLDKPIEDLNKETTMIIMPWYGVTYTEEWQCQGKILMRHISISLGIKPSELLSVKIGKQIMKLFGFQNNVDDCIIHIEEFATNHKAINILEAIACP
jgi:hypothetical protein